MQSRLFLILTLAGFLMIEGCTPSKEAPPKSQLAVKMQRFAPTVITGDTASLSEGDRRALPFLFQAAQVMDRIYTRQVWSGNEELRQTLETDKTPDGLERLKYFTMNMGPWSRLDHDEPFVGGVPQQRPPFANYYPPEMTREEFNTWVATLPEVEQRKATGFFCTIRRDEARRLKVVPYNEEYKDLLVSGATLLRKAADLTDNKSLREYLNKRAEAFLSNDYYESDLAWMELDSPIDVTIGPYEVYLDEVFNYKAAFEAYIALRNEKETAKLADFSSRLQEIENNLPIEPRYRNPKLGALSPIRVVDEIAIGGEARAGVQTAAFNLPNDERITSEKGSKRVMLRNVQQAKFQKILVPISALAIDPTQQPMISFDPFFTHILAHELMHGLGPHAITVMGKRTTVRQAMKDLSSALEEAKADIAGLFALQYLIDKRFLSPELQRPMYVTFLAGVFRSVRFGINEAHGRGMALQFNYMTDEGAFIYNETTGTYRVDFEKAKAATIKLTREIMTIQAEGSYTKAKALLERYAEIRTPLKRTLDKLATVPVDIDPQFPLAGQ